MNLPKDIHYIGVNDHAIDLFEGQYPVPNGMSYNSYLIRDEKIAVMDSVDAGSVDAWLKNLQAALGDAQPDFLIVQHMEPDHSAGIAAFMAAYPGATVAASAKAFSMMRQFFGTDFAGRSLTLAEGATLNLGRHTLTFYTAPMVHWPEVIVTYDAASQTLFSADAFGKFGALDVEDDEGWACEARRYYFGIVGKYGAQVLALLKKVGGLAISCICPLHGPVLTDDLASYLSLYQTWASYQPESEGVTIAYTSVYGHTKAAVEKLAEKLTSQGCPTVSVFDLARCDMAEAVEDAFRYGKLVLATTTYNGDIFPFMRTFIQHLLDHGYRDRQVGIIDNGTWAPMAAKTIKALMENCKNITFTETTVTIRSALNAESEQALDALAAELWP